MSQLPWEAVVADPSGVLEQLRSQRAALEQQLGDVAERIELVTRMAETREEWQRRYGSPSTTGPEGGPSASDPSAQRPGSQEGPGPSTAQGPAAGPPNAAQEDKGTAVPRRVQVESLLGQDPSRWWKTRQIAEELGVDNHRSLRVLLDQMTKQGRLVKKSASFRYNDGRDLPGPGGGNGG
ncbi:hypothetical protein [Thermomonospora echinospora]|uniref:hypothetical protein n=1 Tax=Thermomonospora echinospora TaxID=1992 RepID=UPI000CDF0593|nr:hypothetical protein [Thermomonospora echinospora]